MENLQQYSAALMWPSAAPWKDLCFQRSNNWIAQSSKTRICYAPHIRMIFLAMSRRNLEEKRLKLLFHQQIDISNTKRWKDKKTKRWTDKKTKKKVQYCDVMAVLHTCNVFQCNSKCQFLDFVHLAYFFLEISRTLP